jgi:hypothetical protein
MEMMHNRSHFSLFAAIQNLSTLKTKKQKQFKTLGLALNIQDDMSKYYFHIGMIKYEILKKPLCMRTLIQFASQERL